MINQWVAGESIARDIARGLLWHGAVASLSERVRHRAGAVLVLAAVVLLAPASVVVSAQALAASSLPSAVSDPQPTPRPHRPKAHLAALGNVAGGEPLPYQLDAEISHWYDERHATLPLSDRPVYCHGYGCEFQTPILIDESDLVQLKRIFAGHSGSAVEERKAISAAVTWWERHASPLLGGPPRQHGSDIAHAHHMGATDCIDEATNSTTILVVLERHGLLKHHIVARPVSRGMIVNAHSTAVIHEIGGEDWAVDMWMHNMGEAPDIMTETQWLSQA